MNNNDHTCDCVGTSSEDALCAAADAMDLKIAEVMQKEADFYSYLVARYGPSNID
jgi:hypothetical protein